MKVFDKSQEIDQFYIDLWNPLSTICFHMFDLQGANLTFYDVANINKDISAYEIENFFVFMIVYGSCPEIKSAAAPIYDHQMQR